VPSFSGSSSPRRGSSCTAGPWRWKYYDPLKHMQHFTSWHGVTLQQTFFFNSNTKRTSYLALSPSRPKSKLEEIHEHLWSTCTHISINTNLNFEFKEVKVHIGQWCYLRRWRRNFEFVLHTSCLETKILLTYGTCVPLYFTYQWQDTLKT
jgi:hypothetical protein